VRVIYGKSKTGKTTEMIKQFANSENSLFISNEVYGSAFIHFYKKLGFTLNPESNNRFGYSEIETLDDIKNLIKDYNYRTVFIDNTKLIQKYPLEKLKQFEAECKINLVLSAQLNRNAEKKLDMIELWWKEGLVKNGTIKIC